ncbi:TetR/AcrR family transcriptional regulator [Rhizobium cremeum]|uniref:TetR/AcrR family transcriptional regulator n=2 Tax=Rhizobium cremeum TaxID=2813827 RepID=UPI000DE14370|nr:TetR/AcrR family transcriptional regulator [Rhizobium cremeum]MCJ7993859.1 TetR/AcrR family transcriptional regulator [Rhizobium cremeum]MCJ7998916.1 TetR/AcrR family transcriptional regulator [Rhizobium cremeum]
MKDDSRQSAGTPAAGTPAARSPGATKKGIETRARIIRGAIEAVESEGMESLTTRKIAARAGVQLATLHYYFDSKESLMLAVLEDLVTDMGTRYTSSVNSTDMDDRIAQLIRLIWRYIGENPNREISQIELTIYALRTQGSEWLAAKQYNTYIDFYSQFIFRNSDIPEPERTRIANAVTRFMLIGIDGLILQNFALGDTAVAAESVEALIFTTQAYLKKLIAEAAA